jgi:hypothetical protein
MTFDILKIARQLVLYLIGEVYSWISNIKCIYIYYSQSKIVEAPSVVVMLPKKIEVTYMQVYFRPNNPATFYFKKALE